MRRLLLAAAGVAFLQADAHLFYETKDESGEVLEKKTLYVKKDRVLIKDSKKKHLLKILYLNKDKIIFINREKETYAMTTYDKYIAYQKGMIAATVTPETRKEKESIGIVKNAAFEPYKLASADVHHMVINANYIGEIWTSREMKAQLQKEVSVRALFAALDRIDYYPSMERSDDWALYDFKKSFHQGNSVVVKEITKNDFGLQITKTLYPTFGMKFDEKIFSPNLEYRLVEFLDLLR